MQYFISVQTVICRQNRFHQLYHIFAVWRQENVPNVRIFSKKITVRLALLKVGPLSDQHGPGASNHRKAPKGTERYRKAPKGNRKATERHRKAPKGTERQPKCKPNVRIVAQFALLY